MPDQNNNKNNGDKPDARAAWLTIRATLTASQMHLLGTMGELFEDTAEADLVNDPALYLAAALFHFCGLTQSERHGAGFKYAAWLAELRKAEAIERDFEQAMERILGKDWRKAA